MEPSGLMDSSRSHVIYGEIGNSKDAAKDKGDGSYHVYDVGDEEVHFTKNPMPGSAVPFSLSYLPETQPSSPSSLRFMEVSLNQQQSLAHQDQAPIISPERAKSSRLLNSIGSKLRRGSNYLVAPKLVGQYLLGITIRSWTEFLNTSRMLTTPSNTHQLTRRLVSNLNYFQGNYLCVSLILVIYCVLTSPLLLLAIVAYVSALYFITARSAIGKPFHLLSFRPNLQQQYSFLTLISLPLLWVAGAPSAIFWIIGASFVVVGLHASMYNGEKSLHQLPPGDQPVVASGVVGAGSSSHGVASNGLGFRASQVPYYAHYPTAAASDHYQYVSLPSTPARGSMAANSQPGYSTISQWMPFGRNNSGSQHTFQANNSTPQRIPDVTIISHDFAGLGRVYEV